MNEHIERKERLRTGLALAQYQGRSMKDVAEATGIPHGTIRSFASTGRLGKKYAADLESWLNQEGIPVEDPFADMSSPRTIVANELRALADMLTNPNFSDALAASKVAAWIRVNHDSLQELSAALKQGSNGAE